MLYPGMPVNQAAGYSYPSHNSHQHRYANRPEPNPQMKHAKQHKAMPREANVLPSVPQHTHEINTRHPRSMSQVLHSYQPLPMTARDLGPRSDPFQAPVHAVTSHHWGARMHVPQPFNNIGSEVWPDITCHKPRQHECCERREETIEIKEEVPDSSNKSFPNECRMGARTVEHINQKMFQNNNVVNSGKANVLVISPIDANADSHVHCQSQQPREVVPMACSDQQVLPTASCGKQTLETIQASSTNNRQRYVHESNSNSSTGRTNRVQPNERMANVEYFEDALNDAVPDPPSFSGSDATVAVPVDVDLSDDSEHSLTDLITNLGKVASYMRATLECAVPMAASQKKPPKRASKDPRQDIIKQTYKKPHKPFANGLIKKASSVRICKPRRYDISCFLQKSRYQSKRGKKLNDVMNTFSDLKLKRKSDTESLWRALRTAN